MFSMTAYKIFNSEYSIVLWHLKQKQDSNKTLFLLLYKKYIKMFLINFFYNFQTSAIA